MATDAGLVDISKDMLSIAGTHSEADAIHSPISNDFFESRIKKVVAKPLKRKI